MTTESFQQLWKVIAACRLLYGEKLPGVQGTTVHSIEENEGNGAVAWRKCGLLQIGESEECDSVSDDVD